MTPEKKADEWRPIFLETLAETCNVSKACVAAEISRQTAYRHRNTPAYHAFKDAWDAALEVGGGALEDEAVRRAHEGWEEPIFYKGEQTATVRKFSDTLLIFLLKAHFPKKYRERYEVSGPNGGKIEFDISSDDLRADILGKLSGLTAASGPGSVPEETEQD